MVFNRLSAPLIGPLKMANVTGPSTSLPVSTRLVEVSSGVVTLWLLATGASLIAVTVMLTVAVAELVRPSLTRNVKLSPPL